MTRIQINPTSTMNLLSQQEVNLVRQSADSPLYNLFRTCALAVLSSGTVTDNVETTLGMHKDFHINVLQRGRGVKLELINPPESAFVDGKIIVGINELLFAVLRDILFVAAKHGDVMASSMPSIATTNLVFDILRNAQVLQANRPPNLVVCWGWSLDLVFGVRLHQRSGL